MIKYLNKGEVKSIRRGYFKTILLKILSMYKLDAFQNISESMERACRIYKILMLLNEGLVPNSSKIMLEYLVKYNHITQSLCDSIKEYYLESLDIEEDDDKDYYDFWQEREDVFIKIVESTCESCGLEYDIDYSVRIFVGEDINNDIFKCIQKELRSPDEQDNPDYYKSMSVEELEEEYYSSFEQDSIIIGIKDFILSDDAYILLHDLCGYDYTIILDSIFIMDRNTYLEISYNLLEEIEYSFFVVLVLALKKLI